jgi:hypothetical protein
MADKKSKIAEKAYYKYLERGGNDGQDMNDWLEAEKELSAKKPVVKKAAAKKKTAAKNPVRKTK